MDTIEVTMYKEMQRIRLFEERVNMEFQKQEMRTPMHSYIGQEAIAVGTCMNLTKEDKIYSNHRGHGHYLAKGGDMNSLVAELYNRSYGCSKGYGGSMHILDPKVGVALTSSIVAGNVPIATGNAFAYKIKKEHKVVIAFFGDGASEEGVVYESICYAKLKKLPIVYICENNLYAMYTSMELREPLSNVADKFKTILPTDIIDGNDVESVYSRVGKAIERARTGGGPSFIECKTYRMRNHYESPNSVDFWYRSKEEWQDWKKRCPINRLVKTIQNRGETSEDQLKEIDREILEEIDKAFELAKSSPYPDKSELLKYKSIGADIDDRAKESGKEIY